MKLKDGFDSNYRYILVAARRARQLSGGAPVLVNTTSRKVCKIAQQEIDAGKVQFLKGEAAAPVQATATPPTATAEEK
jgi:DNA-directed RNA polymerase subunit omega